MKPIYLEKSLGIDIGEESVAIALLGKQIRTIKILASGFFRISPLKDSNEPAERAFLDEINRFLMKYETVWDHTVISLPRRFITLKSFDLPAPNKKSIDSMVEFELERHFATGVEDLYYAFQARGKSENLFFIDLFAIKKEIADYYLNLLQRVNLKPSALEISTSCNLRFISPKGSLAEKTVAVLGLSSNNLETNILKDGKIESSRNIPIEHTDYQHIYFQSEPEEAQLEKIARELSPILIEEIQICLAGSPNVEDDETIQNIYIFDGALCANYFCRHLEQQTQVPSSQVFSNIEYDFDEPADFVAPHMTSALGLALRGLQSSESDINLLPSELRPKRKKFSIRTTLGLAAGVILLSLGVLAAKIIHNDVTLSSLESQLGEVKIQVGALEKIDLEFENLKRYVTIFNSIDQRTPLKLPVIQELTKILPRDTWLTDIYIIKNRIEIKGFSASVAKLIPLLENSKYFKDASFNGSIVRQNEGDKFTIRAALDKVPT